MSATVRDVAKAANVSPSTVSRVLSGAVPVRDELRQRVLIAVEKLHYTYRPVQRTASVGSGISASVGVLVPRFSGSDFLTHPTIYNIFTTFVDVLSKVGISNTAVLIDRENLNDLDKLFTPRHQGYLIVGTTESDERILMPYLMKMSIPHIVVNRWMDEYQQSYVNVDDRQAAFDAVRHMIALGHRHIAFVGGQKELRCTALRRSGYKAAMEEAGLPVLPEHLHYCDNNEASGVRVAGDLLSLTPRPTAGFFCSDMVAIGCQRRMRERGVRLPQDFSMVGYGNMNLSSYVRPQLTTVDMPIGELGRHAALMMQALILDPTLAQVRVLLKAKLVLRGSTHRLAP